ncbi:MAG: UDP-glucose/GDP-mannose dehydrogenase family protein [Nocardioidaceae bacterium]|nr:UDP-glucose/GDP-mannose dehydrogenase family protein [Nocardioidaceae bacterium]
MNPPERGTELTVRISVLGTGYLGATHAACLAACGHQVVGIDTNPAHVKRLATGRAPFQEPGLDRLLAQGLRAGNLSFSTDYDAAAAAEVHFVCVGTPQAEASEAADLSALWAALESLAPLLVGPSLVVGKSTVPVGTAARARHLIRRIAPGGDSVELAWNPEFLREGHAIEDSLRPDRLVFGVESNEADLTLREVYAPVIAAGVATVRTDLATAELAKAAANVMLAARVSLANLFAEVCEAADADVGDLTMILGYDARIGSAFLTPGIGYGGGCLPKDTRAFLARAQELGAGEPAKILREIDAINLRQRARTVDLAVSVLGGSAAGANVTALGAAFKAGSDDVRDSPALDIASRLHSLGARVRVSDPAALRNARRAKPELLYDDDAISACSGADLVMVLTDWADFQSIDPVALLDVVAAPRAIDGRLCLDPDKWRAAGWELHALGRRSAAGPG